MLAQKKKNLRSNYNKEDIFSEDMSINNESSDDEINTFSNDSLFVQKINSAIERLLKELTTAEHKFPHLIKIFSDRMSINNKEDRLKTIYNIFNQTDGEFNVEEDNMKEDYIVKEYDSVPILNLLGKKKIYKANEALVTKVGEIIGEFVEFMKRNLVSKLNQDNAYGI